MSSIVRPSSCFVLLTVTETEGGAKGILRSRAKAVMASLRFLKGRPGSALACACEQTSRHDRDR